MFCNLTKEVGVLEDIQLAIEAVAGQIELFGLSLQGTQLITGFIVVVLHIGEVSLQPIQCVCGLSNTGPMWIIDTEWVQRHKTVYYSKLCASFHSSLLLVWYFLQVYVIMQEKYAWKTRAIKNMAVFSIFIISNVCLYVLVYNTRSFWITFEK